MRKIKVYGKVNGKLREWIVEFPSADGSYFKAIHFLKAEIKLDGGAVCEVIGGGSGD